MAKSKKLTEQELTQVQSMLNAFNRDRLLIISTKSKQTTQ